MHSKLAMPFVITLARKKSDNNKQILKKQREFLHNSNHRNIITI
jgi:hypothetical protein